MTDRSNDNVTPVYDDNHIAVIGMSGRYPKCDNLQQFWEILRDGKDALSDLEDSDLDAMGIPSQLYQDPDYVKRGSKLPHADSFDAEFFGFIPREAASTDPQTRVFLETCYEALESAGYDPLQMDAPVGVFAGSAANDYASLQSLPDPSDPTSAFEQLIGREKDFLATRVAHRLNLKGPALTLQTACSTSLVAIHQAIQSLLSYESTVCLAGGVTLSFRTNGGYLYQEGMILSPDGRCRAFDANASGTSLGQGCGVVVLKRLAEAVADGNHILAVVRGSAVNNDGADKIGYTAPSESGQAEVITMAHQLAEVESDTIGYIEAHGTGTKLGDPIEIAALSRAFAPGTQRRQYCAIGSVKTNFGHTDTAAGVTGFMKAVLSLYHKKLLPNLHFQEANPAIGFDETPFYVSDKLQDWPSADTPRRAGVSSFGIGGTNAHMILEEAPAIASKNDVTGAQLLPLSARTPESLDHAVANLHTFLKTDEVVRLGDVSHTLRHGRASFPHRATLVVQHNSDTQAYEVFSHKDSIGEKPVAPPRLVWMYSGQGSQYAGMCAQLYADSQVFKSAIDICAELFKPHLETDIRTLMFTIDDAERSEQLSETRFTQPALFCIEYAMSCHLTATGATPDAVIGHSIGEFAAAVQAGIMSLQDAVYAVSQRASLMQSMDTGSMLSVALSVDELTPLLPKGLIIAVENTPELSVVAGPDTLIQQFQTHMESSGHTANHVRTSHAFHTPMMNMAAERFLEIMQQITLTAPVIPMTSNITGEWMTSAEATSPEYWASQITSRVRFSRCLATASTLDPATEKLVLLETGPGRVLAGLARAHPDIDPRRISIAHAVKHPSDVAPDSVFTLQAVGKLWASGVELDWDAIQDTSGYRKTPLPTYPFDRKRHWAPEVSHVMELPQFQPQNTPSNAVATPVPSVEALAGQSVANMVAIGASSDNTTLTNEPPQTLKRTEHLLELLREMLVELSGIEAEAIDVDSTFTQSGFDSLFMTQLATEVKKRFKVTVTQRQLFEDASTLSLLAQLLDNELPAEQFTPPAPASAFHDNRQATENLQNSATGVTSQVALSAGMVVTSNNGFVAQQLNFISQQLALLARTSASLDALPTATRAQENTPTRTKQNANVAGNTEVTRLPVRSADSGGIDDESLVQQVRYGPWKQINLGQHNEVSSEQVLALKDLITQYVARTGASKAHTDQYRSDYSDPRSVAGFNRLWKEIIYPIVAERSDGATIWDIDGNKYVDVQSGFGSIFLGHNVSFINDAITRQLSEGMLIGPQHRMAGSVAKALCTLTGTERSTFCNTGSEAVLAAVRISRTQTGKDKIVMFTQDYHGIFDEVVARRVGAVDSLRTLPAAPGIPNASVDNTIVLEYGDPASLAVLESLKDEVAAILVEPVQSRRPELQPKEFIQHLRQWTVDNNSVLIFDEVISGFRIHPRGAQGWYGIEADLCTYGKIVGGGLPIGMLAGKQHLMDILDGGGWHYGDDSVPEVGVTYFAGTFVRHPLAVVAADATINYLMEHGQGIYDDLNESCDKLAAEINQQLIVMQAPLHLQNCGSMMYLEFLSGSVFNPLFFYYVRLTGLFISDYGSFFPTLAHSEDDFAFIRNTIIDAAVKMQKHGFFPELPALASESQS